MADTAKSGAGGQELVACQAVQATPAPAQFIDVPSAPPTASSAMLTPEQAAARLGVKTQTLAAWRCSGRHSLPFYRPAPRMIRYAAADIDAFLEANKLRNTAGAVA